MISQRAAVIFKDFIGELRANESTSNNAYSGTNAPTTTNAASKTRPVTVVESSYDSTTKRWYRKYSDGWIEQGGYFDNGSGMGARTRYAVTFGSGMEFTQTPLFIHCCQNSSGSGSGYQGLYGVESVSASGFTYMTGYSGNNNSTGFYWTAKGL